MGLRQQAAADLRTILEDDGGGFGWPITITDPTGVTASLKGRTTDIGHTIDPQTGAAVVGRMASVALPLAALTEAGLGIPRGSADDKATPWVVSFAGLDGTAYMFKVMEGRPDRALGVVVCMLEQYRI